MKWALGVCILAIIGLAIWVSILRRGPENIDALYSPAYIAAGKTAYTANCGGCHGPDAKGTEQGKSIAGKSENKIHKSVRLGKEEMPAFSVAQLSDEDLSKIKAFVTQLE